MVPYPSTAPGAPSIPAPRWEILIAGELGDKEAPLHQQLLDVPPRSEGIMYFDSCGGSAFVGLALAALIRLRGLRAVAVVTGECSSAALLPLAACPERYVLPQSTLLFHPLRWQSDEQVHLVEAQEFARHFSIIDSEQDRVMARLFGCSDELLRKWTYPGRFVSGTDMIDAGLARPLDLFAGDLWTQIHLGRQSRMDPQKLV